MQPPRPRYGEAREALTAAAIRTVAKLGLRGLTYRAVAAEAGVSYGAVTHHFGSREALIEEALKSSAARAASLSSIEQEQGRVEDFLRGMPAAIESTRDNHAFQFELALEARRDNKLAPPVREVYALYHQAIGRELQRVGADHDSDFSRLVLAALDGLVFQQVVGVSSRAEVEASLERLRGTLQILISSARRTD